MTNSRPFFFPFPGPSVLPRRSRSRFQSGAIFFPAFLALLVGAAGTSGAQLLLNEILYDPQGSDEGKEWVEILNQGPWPAPADGLYLDFGNGTRPGEWVRIWSGRPGTWIEPGEHFLVGRRTDGPVHEEVSLGLQNGPDAIRLGREGWTLDRVGWGEPLDPGFFEGRPAPTATDGQSLSRIGDMDSDDNSLDFVARKPSPGRTNQPRFDLTLTVGPGGGRAFPIRPDDPSIPLRLRLRNEGALPVHLGDVLCTLSGDHEPLPGAILEPGGVVDWEAEAPFVRRMGLALVDGRLDFPADENPEGNVDTLALALLPSPVFLSEIHPKPEEGEAEWVELELTAAIDLQGWELADAAGGRCAVETNGLRARGREVLSADAAVTTLPTRGWPQLNDRAGSSGVADSLFLLDPEGRIRDWAVYGTAVTSRSWVRRPGTGSSHPADSWFLDDEHPGGTPGRDGGSGSVGGSRDSDSDSDSESGAAPPETVSFVSPRENVQGIWFALRPGTRTAAIRAFDLTGRLVSHVFRQSYGDRIRWEPRDGSGHPLPPGVYIVDVETETVAGRRHQRRTVVVGH